MNSLFCVFNKTVFICFKFFRIRKGQVQSFFVVSFFRVINICVIVVVVVVDVGVFVIIVEYPRIKVFKTITRDCYCIIVQFETKVQICFLVIYIYTNIGCYISIYIYIWWCDMFSVVENLKGMADECLGCCFGWYCWFLICWTVYVKW